MDKMLKDFEKLDTLAVSTCCSLKLRLSKIEDAIVKPEGTLRAPQLRETTLGVPPVRVSVTKSVSSVGSRERSFPLAGPPQRELLCRTLAR